MQDWVIKNDDDQTDIGHNDVPHLISITISAGPSNNTTIYGELSTPIPLGIQVVTQAAQYIN